MKTYKILQSFFTAIPVAIGIKVETPPAGRAGKEGEGSEFIIQLPVV
jgi:hypothetical protein